MWPLDCYVSTDALVLWGVLNDEVHSDTDAGVVGVVSEHFQECSRCVYMMPAPALEF